MTEKKITTRDFLKLAAAVVGASTLLAGGNEIRKFFGATSNVDLEHPTNAPEIKKIAEICAWKPISLWTEPTSLNKITTNLNPKSIDEKTFPYQENPPRANKNNHPTKLSHLRYRPTIGPTIDLKNRTDQFSQILGVNKSYLRDSSDGPMILLEYIENGEKKGQAIPDVLVESVEVSENVNSMLDPNLPKRITTLIPKDSAEQSLVAATYTQNENAPGDITEIFSLTDISRYLCCNARDKFGILQFDAETATVKETMVLGDHFVLTKFEAAGRQGLFAFDLKTRKPIDIFSINDLDTYAGLALTESVNDFLGNFGFTHNAGVLLADNTPTQKDRPIIDLKQGLIATASQMTHNEVDKRLYFLPSIRPDYTHCYRASLPAYDTGPTDYPAQLIVLPFLGDWQEVDSVGDIDHIIEQSITPYVRTTSLIPGSEQHIQMNESPSSNPPSLIMRPPVVAEIMPSGKSDDTYQIRVLHIHIFDEFKNPISQEGISKPFIVDITNDRQLGDVVSNQQMRYQVDGDNLLGITPDDQKIRINNVLPGSVLTVDSDAESGPDRIVSLILNGRPQPWL